MKKNLLFLLIPFILLSCAEKNDVLDVETHSKNWVNEESSNFHGEYVVLHGSESCKSCHGKDYSGGSSGIACSTCHSVYPHSSGFTQLTSEQFHGNYIREHGWNLSECQSCHGESFNLPTTETSCIECHTNPGGPTACNTCHGSERNNAPPKDLNGNITTENPGVGAHQSHLFDTDLTTEIRCQECHPMINDFWDTAHIDETPGVTIHFDTLASHNGDLMPVFSSENHTCQNVYCHGNFTFLKANSTNSWAYTADSISGNNYTVTWNKVDMDEAECGTCHDLPPKGHLNNSNCYACHSKVVNAQNEIIDKTLHINGKIDVF